MVASGQKPALNVGPGRIEVDGIAYVLAPTLAEELGISRQTLWRWRRDGRIPRGHLYRRRLLMFTEEDCQRVREHANRVEPAFSNESGVEDGQAKS